MWDVFPMYTEARPFGTGGPGPIMETPDEEKLENSTQP